MNEHKEDLFVSGLRLATRKEFLERSPYASPEYLGTASHYFAARVTDSPHLDAFRVLLCVDVKHRRLHAYTVNCKRDLDEVNLRPWTLLSLERYHRIGIAVMKHLDARLDTLRRAMVRYRLRRRLHIRAHLTHTTPLPSVLSELVMKYL